MNSFKLALLQSGVVGRPPRPRKLTPQESRRQRAQIQAHRDARASVGMNSSISRRKPSGCAGTRVIKLTNASKWAKRA